MNDLYLEEKANLSYRVLLVEDNEDDYVIVRDLLTDITATRFDLEWVDTYEDARKLLARERYDICLLDYRLGEATGVDLIREFGGGATPFILLTGDENYEVDVAAAKAGAADYLLKGHINAPLMERSIRYAIERKKTEAALLHAQRFAQATVDALPANIAVLDGQGTVIALNAAWRNYAQNRILVVASGLRGDVTSGLRDALAGESNGFIGSNINIGANYLQICEGSRTESRDSVVAGLRSVIAGEMSVFSLEYPSLSSDVHYWFRMSATRFVGDGPVHIVVAHENITERKQAETALLAMRDELEVRVEERTAELEQSNATLQSEILERERAEREVRARARQHEAVAELGRRALLDSDLATLFQTVVDLISTTLEVDICTFWERVPDRDTLRLRAAVGLNQSIESVPTIELGDGSQIAYAVLHNQPVISENLNQETRFRPSTLAEENGMSSTIAVPVNDGELHGVLSACALSAQKFSQNEVYFLQMVANILSSAIARKQAEAKILQLNSNLQGANDELRANEVRLLKGNQISTELMRLRVRTDDELQEALHHITEAACTMLDIQRSSVWLFNEEGTLLRCLDLYERDSHRHTSGFELPKDESYFQLIKAQRVIVADDTQADASMRGYGDSYFKPNHIGSTLDVALVVGGKHIGVLCYEHVGAPRPWEAEDQTFATAVASVCSLVLESYERARTEIALHAAKEEAERATEEANTANQAKSQFLSRMSHELRTPLNAILGFGQLLDTGELPPADQESVQQILKGGRHLLGLINEVLDIARVEAGRMELSIEPIALHDVIAESCALVRPLATERQILLSDHTDKWGGTYVLADLQRLKQVLLNLLSNAIKYNHPLGQVTISCQHREGDKIRIEVRDTGAGIAPADLPKLFTPFERLNAAQMNVEGTGLGLALSQRLVEAMGGMLSVESTPGQGSTFFIELPQAAHHEEEVEESSGSTNLDSQADAETTYSILCIEDNLSNLRLIERVLARRPHVTLLSAMQGSVGLDLAHQHRPDLILLDLNLPDVSGLEVLTQLRLSDTTKEIPVIILSADATPTQRQRLIEAGARAYLTKPLNIVEFLLTLDEILG